MSVDRRRWLQLSRSLDSSCLLERHDDGALDRLRAVGRRLLDAAGGEVAPPTFTSGLHILNCQGPYSRGR